MEDICRFGHLPSNGVTAKIALRDLGLLFNVTIFKIIIFYREQAQIMHGTTFKDLGHDLDLLFQGKRIEILIYLKQ